MTLLTIPEAAARLGVSDRQVRKLVESGALNASRLGGVWVLDERDVLRRGRRAPGTGRVWAPRTAWAAVDILRGGDGRVLLDQPRTSRLRSQLRRLTASEVHRLAERRAALHRFHASPRARSRVEDALVPSGVSAVTVPEAARRFGLAGVEKEDRVEGYLIGDLDALIQRLRLTPEPSGEITVRHVAGGMDATELLGTDALIALDLMDSDDVRERARGRDVLEGMLRNV